MTSKHYDVRLCFLVVDLCHFEGYIIVANVLNFCVILSDGGQTACANTYNKERFARQHSQIYQFTPKALYDTTHNHMQWLLWLAEYCLIQNSNDCGNSQCPMSLVH